MIRALYTAASGLISGLRRQETVASNLANISTPGYRGESAAAGSFASVLVRSVRNAAIPVPLTLHRTLGTLGTGTYVADRVSLLDDGELRPTDLALDLAIRGAGFFALRGPGRTLYTRDGHFRRDASGLLISGDGLPVLGGDGQPITIGDGAVQIAPGGAIFVGGQQAGTLRVADIPRGSLVRAGANRFVAAAGAQVTAVAAPVLVQGALEESNVDIGRAASRLFAVSGQFDANQRVFQTVEESLERAVREIGRVG